MRRNAGPRIVYLNQDPITVTVGREAYLSFVIGQRVKGVTEKIVQYLAHHGLVSCNLSDVVVDLDFEFRGCAGPLYRHLGALFGN